MSEVPLYTKTTTIQSLYTVFAGGGADGEGRQGRRWALLLSLTLTHSLTHSLTRSLTRDAS